MTASPGSFLSRHRLDVVALMAISAVSFLFANRGAARIHPSAFEAKNFDIYLQGDLPRTYTQMLTRFHNGARSALHPLYPVTVHPATQAARSLFDLSAAGAVRVTLGLLAVAWAVMLFLVGRAARLGVLDSALITGVGLAGASARFWLTVPETFLPGGIALLFALMVAAYGERRQLGDAWYIASGAASFGSTITNWSTGLLLALTTGSIGRGVRIALQVVGVVTILWVGERLVYPNIAFIFDSQGVGQHLRVPDAARAVEVTRAFVLHTAVAPRLEACASTPLDPAPFLLSFQAASIASGGRAGVVATGVWLAMLVLGAYSLLRLPNYRAMRFVLAGSLLSQFLLHVLYGGETFLYSIHWWGLLVAMTALALHTRVRSVARSLAVVFILAAGTHNLRTWESALPVFQNGAADFPRNQRSCDE